MSHLKNYTTETRKVFVSKDGSRIDSFQNLILTSYEITELSKYTLLSQVL